MQESRPRDGLRGSNAEAELAPEYDPRARARRPGAATGGMAGSAGSDRGNGRKPARHSPPSGRRGGRGSCCFRSAPASAARLAG
jgi:hypothetical protein